MRKEPSPLRTRIRVDDEDAATMSLTQLRDGSQVTWTGIPYCEFSQFDLMVDRLNPANRSNFRLPGPCYHEHISAGEKFASEFTQPEWVNGELKATTYVSPYPLLPLSKSGFRTALGQIYESSFPANIEQEFKLSAWNKWKTQIPEDVSLANFAYELKDFDYLIKNFRTQRKISKDLNPEYRKAKRTIHPKDMPSMANSTFLSWNFGWAPFIGDLQKLSGLYDSISKRIDFLVKHRGERVQLKYRRVFPGVLPDEPLRISTAAGGGNTQIREFEVIAVQRILSASCVLVQDIPELESEWGRLKATLAASGFNNPAKIVWNAIPFSFMVDWMLPMQSLLQRWTTVQPFTGRWDIYDVTWSVKTLVTVNDVYRGLTTNGGIHSTFRQSRTISYVAYDRKVGMPLTPEEVALSGLSSHQQRLFASLLAANTLFAHGKH